MAPTRLKLIALLTVTAATAYKIPTWRSFSESLTPIARARRCREIEAEEACIVDFEDEDDLRALTTKRASGPGARNLALGALAAAALVAAPFASDALPIGDAPAALPTSAVAFTRYKDEQAAAPLASDASPLGDAPAALPTSAVAFTRYKDDRNDVFYEEYPKAIAIESCIALAILGLSKAGIGPLADRFSST